QLAHTFGSGGLDTTFKLDRLQVSLDGAPKDGAAGNRRGGAGRAGEGGAGAEGAQLLSKQLELQKTATLVGVREHAAEVRVARLRTKLREAADALAQARTQAPSTTTETRARE